MVSMLTRKVRLPIPFMAQIDQARPIASSYEQQKFTDLFRVPFMRHPEHAPDLPPPSDEDETDDDEAEAPLKGKTERQERPAFESSKRDTVPSWVRDEQVVDKLGGVPSGGAPATKQAHDNPEHFKLFQRAMEEWWQYDVYARISMLYGVIQFLFAVTYYSIGTTISELRGFWISWSLPMLFLTAQALILRLDILRDNGQKMLPHCEWFGHLAPYMAIIGTTLEFQYWHKPTLMILTWFFVIFAFFGHFVMALRMLDLAWPDMEREKDMAEEPTKQWWPSAWKVPTSFSKALWILAPPKKLEPGQHCLLHEMEDLKHGGAAITACRRRRRPAGAKGGPSGRRWRSPEELAEQCERIDGVFRRWFEQGWAQLSLRHREQLEGLYRNYQEPRRRVDQLPAPAGGPEASGSGYAVSGLDEGLLMQLGSDLNAVEDSLEEFKNKAGGVQAGSAAGEGAYTGKSPFKDFGSKRAPDLPWQVMRVAICTVALQWFYMMIASGVECALGPESLLKPAGEPPWIRDTKMRSWTPAMVHTSADAAVPEGYELFNPPMARPALEEGGHHSGALPPAASGAADASEAGHGSGHRRLAEEYGRRPEAALRELLRVLPSVGRLVDHMDAADGLSGPGIAAVRDVGPADATELAPATMLSPAFMGPALRPRNVAWPAFFEPKHLLCEPRAGSRGAVAALTPRGFGALVPQLDDEGEVAAEARPFALEGATEFGPLAGAAWTHSGLQLVTKAGQMLHCPGHAPTGLGTWPCQAASGKPLPLPNGARLLAAAIGERTAEPGGGLAARMAAILLEDLPGIVALFDEDGGDAGWRPAGEVHLPPGCSAGDGLGLSLSGDELLMVTGRGEVHRRHLLDGTAAAHAAPAGAKPREFHAACAHPGGELLRLALRQSARPGGLAWSPELLAEGR